MDWMTLFQSLDQGETQDVDDWRNKIFAHDTTSSGVRRQNYHPLCPPRCKELVLGSGAETNLKVEGAPVQSKSGGTDPVQSAAKIFLVMPLNFLAPKARLVVLVSAFMVVSTVWSVYFLLFFYSRCPSPYPAICKSGGHVPRAPWSRRHWCCVVVRVRFSVQVVRSQRHGYYADSRPRRKFSTIVDRLYSLSRFSFSQLLVDQRDQRIDFIDFLTTTCLGKRLENYV